LKRTVFGVILITFLASTLLFSLEVQPAETGSTTIIVPDDYPTIQQAINASTHGDTIFVKSGIYYERIFVDRSVSIIGENRNNTVIDGNWSGTIVTLNAHDIILSNFTIRNSYLGIKLSKFSRNTINNNILIDLFSGGIVGFWDCDDNIIRNNVFVIYGSVPICLSDDSDNNVIDNNTIISPGVYAQIGIWLQRLCDGNTISNNIIANHSQLGRGIYITFESNNNTIKNNKITNNTRGIMLIDSHWNSIYHNSFINNSQHVVIQDSDIANSWDDGYPSGGNYWSDYSGQDSYSGPYQNETGSDQIGDTPIIIGTNNTDRYPLINPWTNIAIINVEPHKTVIPEGDTLFIKMIIEHEGTSMNSINATTYVNSTLIDTLTDVTLSGHDFTTITFAWNTTSFPKGNYTLIANITQVFGELNLVDNLFTYGTICVSILGDVNGDGKVRIDDILTIAIAFGSDLGDPEYEPNLDINGDNKIRVDDILIAALNFGLG